MTHFDAFCLGDIGGIINDIMNSHRFKINSMIMCRVEQANAEEFYEVSTSGGCNIVTLQTLFLISLLINVNLDKIKPKSSRK